MEKHRKSASRCMPLPRRSAITVLIEALHSAKESESISLSSGIPLNLAIFHAAAEICEIIVTDPVSSSVSVWIDHATDLHKALHSSSPGSNRKDSPSRLLEWIDAGVVYHKNGAVGLLRYAAVLASGGDAHITSTNILVSDSMDVENVVGDSSNESDVNVVENLLGKLVTDKSFDGVVLRDSSVAQLITAIRILTLISENTDVATSLFDEGAMTVIYVILVNSRLMLERSSNNYDYLVDDGVDCSSTSDLLLERNRENPKLAACVVDLSSSYPDAALGLETICHLIVSALAYWPAHAWAPGLFHTLLDSVQAVSLPTLGPKETCSMLCLLIDLYPDEGVWHWKNGMPLVTATRSLALGTLLGPLVEKKVNWYLEHPYVEVLLSQLSPHLDKIAQVVLHYALSTLIVVQDMLRILILRIARQRPEYAIVLLQPIISWIKNSSLDEMNAYKALLLKEGTLQILTKVLGRIDIHGKSVSDGRISKLHGLLDSNGIVTAEDSAIVFDYVFKLCQLLPVGNELLACLAIFKELASCAEGQKALLDAFMFIRSSNINENKPGKSQESHEFYNHLISAEWRRCPLLCCWINLYRSVENEGLFADSAEAIIDSSKDNLSELFFLGNHMGMLFNKDRVDALKYLFGLLNGADGANDILEENMRYVQNMSVLLSSKVIDDEYVASSNLKVTLQQAVESARCLSLLLLKPIELLKADDAFSEKVILYSSDVKLSSKIHLLTDSSSRRVDNEWYVGELGERFQWECPENLRNRLSQAGLLGKRKVSTVDGPIKHSKVENSPADVRGSGPSVIPPIPTRRDTFRQRKPNTSRPPSMHVDDYVARERNSDSNPNVIAIPRLGSTGGRPPSIHVDEFMARQRERQNAAPMAGVESVSLEKKITPDIENDTEKSNRSKQLKVDLDDDLQGIDIVFDAEENETDDKLPFPQADDDIQRTASASAERSPQHSIVEETESNAKDMEANVAPNVDDNAQSELSSRMSVSRPGVQLRREPSVSSEKKYIEQPEEMNKNVVIISAGSDSAALAKPSGLSSPVYGIGSPSVQVPASSRTPPSFFPNNKLQRVKSVPLGKPQGYHEQKHFPDQPPLPPTPPPSTISPVRSQVSEPFPASTSPYVNPHNDVQPPMYSTYAQSDYQSSFGNVPTSLASSNFMMDSRYARTDHSSPSGSSRPLPPLPPTPPPFSAGPLNLSSRSPTSQSSVYVQSNTGTTEVSQYAPPPLIPPAMLHILQCNLCNHILTCNHYKPPQLPHSQLPQQLRPPIQSSVHTEKSGSMSQSHVQMQVQPQQIMQQSQMSPYHMYYQNQMQENMPRPQQQQPQVAFHQADAVTQQQDDSSLSLQQYFSSPEAIQSLLSDRDKLCQLLEQHPKFDADASGTTWASLKVIKALHHQFSCNNLV
ncbi:Protein virilizer [Bienertia sinuspersici]